MPADNAAYVTLSADIRRFRRGLMQAELSTHHLPFVRLSLWRRLVLRYRIWWLRNA